MGGRLLIIVLLLLAPAISFAAVGTLKELINIAIKLVQQAIPIIAALALLAFFWGLANFIFYADNEEKRSEGRQIMVWGIIVLFLMVSIWGIVSLINATFFGGAIVPNVPCFPNCVPS